MDKKAIRAAIDDIIDNQLRAEDPPETKQTLERLLREGWNIKDARALIAQCAVVEIFDIMKHHTTFDLDRFVRNLHNLPKKPFEK